MILHSYGAEAVQYEVSGRITPQGPAQVTLFGTAQPFAASAEADQAWKEVEKTAFGGSYWSECLQPLEIKGLKFDGAKRQWNLLYRPWLRGVVDVLTRGALKYSPDNWKRVDNPKVSYLNALQRHLDAFIEGEEKDPETGISHLSHLGCCLMFLKYFEDNQKCETAEEILAREG